MLVLKNPADKDKVEAEVMEEYQALMNTGGETNDAEGVVVQASTLGSLEALLAFLKTSKIPVSGVNIGPVHKRDIMRAAAQLERKKQYAVLLAFDVPIETAANEIAASLGVKIMTANIIYHLFDQFTAYMEALRQEARKEAAAQAVFPCVLKIVPNTFFNKKDPIVMGVDILEGVLKVGTPLVVSTKNFLEIGKVVSIEHNHVNKETAKVCSRMFYCFMNRNQSQLRSRLLVQVITLWRVVISMRKMRYCPSCHVLALIH